jgi:histidine phosphotransfer protein HptB
METDAPTLDPERISMLRDLDDGAGEFLTEVAGEFERDATIQLASTRAALLANDGPGLDRCAHTFKGASANLGAQRLAQLCGTLQTCARNDDFEAAAEADASIATELDRVLAALHDLIGVA